MGIFGMVDDRLRQQWWREITNHPEKRDKVRRAARAVLEAGDPEQELKAIKALRAAFPK